MVRPPPPPFSAAGQTAAGGIGESGRQEGGAGAEGEVGGVGGLLASGAHGDGGVACDSLDCGVYFERRKLVGARKGRGYAQSGAFPRCPFACIRCVR